MGIEQHIAELHYVKKFMQISHKGMADYDAAIRGLEEQFEALQTRTRDELAMLERWAGEQNAGNAFADQVRQWAMSHTERLNAAYPASSRDSA